MSLPRWTNPLAKWLKREAAPDTGAPKQPHAPLDDHRAKTPIPPAAATTPPAEPQVPIPEVPPEFMAWLLGQPTPIISALDPADLPASAVAFLAQIDAVIASDTLRASLLPRAPQVVPQLMSALRDERYSSADVSQRISKDAVLATEVIRLANSALRGDREPVVDLQHAVTAVGASGLRRVIAKSVLRPMFDARGTSLSARAAPQIWHDADNKARLCAALAGNDLLDPLDGYLAGLLHGTGWTALMRALDNVTPNPPPAPTLLGAATATALMQRRDTLFSKLIRPWGLSGPLVALADEIAAVGIAGVRSPLGLALQTADRLAALHVLDADGRQPGGLAPVLDGLPDVMRDCYVSTFAPP
ncbi:hypothetical protein BH11PSE8_BH11PSE8_19580 [soil metagenome]